MDKTYIAQRLKKYLFLISIIFIVLTTSHLIYSYIYSDAKETAIRWGTISEAIIGDRPSLNPLRNNSSEDTYINSILYRSLLTYDLSNKKISPDLAKCDITNLLKIECFLRTNSKWSNWENITSDDIIATFDTLKNSKVNSNMNNILHNIKITKTDTSIIFNSTKKDINVLKIFFQPIVSKKILNIISKKELEWNFSLSSWLYSGKYKVSNLIKEESSNIITITLEKNKQYFKNPVYIETILFKVFPTVQDFLKNKNSINIFNDKNNLISGDIPKLWENKYTLPQYVSVFLNTKKIIDNDLRSLILKEINREEIIKELWEDNYKEIKNPFLEEIYTEDNSSDKNISWILKKQNYYKPSEIVKILEAELKIEKSSLIENSNKKIKDKLISWESKIIEEEEITPIKEIEQKLEEEKTESGSIVELNSAIEFKNTKSKIVTSPNWVDKYNFVSKNNYTLKWVVQENVTSIIINDDKLENFIANSDNFEYIISDKKWNFKKWQNNYKIYFEINWEKELIDEINFFWNTDKNILKQEEKKFFEEKTKELINIERNKEENNTQEIKLPESTNSNIFIKSEKYIQIEKEIQRIKKLDKNYFYNKQWKRFNLELYYISNKVDIQITAEYIKEKIDEKGIGINIRQISTKDLNQLIIDWKKNYDIILTWVNLSYFNFNIYPYYHSSQIEKGYNFSNFRKLDLDIVLEELKSNFLDKEKAVQLEKKVIKILKENNLSKTIYTPILSNLVDKNIKWYSLKENIPEWFYRFNPIYKSYVNQDKAIITENKNFVWYVKFIIDTLF